MKVTAAFLALSACAGVQALGPKPAASWACTLNMPDTLLTPSSSLIWRQENCTAEGSDAVTTVNSLHIDLTAKDVRVVPGFSQDSTQPLLPIGKMAATYPQGSKFLAGINGGYFWRTDITGFWLDDVCRGKTRKDAETPVDDCAAHPNNGLHDGSLIVDGKTVGCNCDKWGYSRPALLATTGGNAEWGVQTLTRGQQAAAGVEAALAAGPNLVSFDASTGQARIDIPDGEDNINRFEHAAQTALGINFAAGTTTATKMVLVTTDGRECLQNQSCGLSDPNLASLMLLHFGSQQAMSMDQGGSTTMVRH